MLENLIVSFFVAALYEADQRRVFDLRPVLHHHALHVVVAYQARVGAAS